MSHDGEAASSSAFDAEETWALEIRREVQRVMWRSAGIVRDSETLRAGEIELESLLRRCEREMRERNGGGLRAHEARNLIVCGLCVLRSASSRKESRGLHYTLDFPHRVEAERKPTVVVPTETDAYGRAPVVSLVATMNAGEQAEIAPADAGAPAR
jgi:L-aspartate oxidase